MLKKRKRGIYIVYIVLSLVFIMLFISVVSAEWFDWLKKAITGKATTQTIEINITVGVPQVITVYNSSINLASGPYEAPSSTDIKINFSVYSPTGIGNLNSSTASVNVTLSGEDTRSNLTCSLITSSGDYANYTCNITMWWWDGSGIWSITASIRDNGSNMGQNSSSTFYVGERTGFLASPSILTWAGISSGSKNQTPNNDPILMNNTGNAAINSPDIQVNATNLRGEEDDTLAIWAGNFTINWSTGGTPPSECSGTPMSAGIYANLSISNLTKGNYTINNGDSGQEELYFCITTIGSELTTQTYSTSNESDWTIKIT